MGTGIPRTHVTYLYTFHFFAGKCARAARERELDIVGRRIKPGFYYMRIQIPRTRPSPYSALRRGVRHGIVERRERPYKYKKTVWAPRESSRGINPCSRILFCADIYSFDPSLMSSLPSPWSKYLACILFLFISLTSKSPNSNIVSWFLHCDRGPSSTACEARALVR